LTTVSEFKQIQSEPREIYLLAGADLKFNVTEISVEKGETVIFYILGAGAFHTFTIDDPNLKDVNGSEIDVSIQVGEIATTTITFPDEDTEFRFYCRPHESAKMEGTIIVGSGTQNNTASVDNNVILLGLGFIGLVAFLNRKLK
jgi:plastocyanin